MKILFLTDIYKHPVDHLPTNHDWLANLWFSNKKYTITKINDILKPNESNIGPELPKKPYTSVLKNSSITKITNYLKETIPSFDYVIAFECCEETRIILEQIHPKIIYIYFSPLRYSNRQTFTLSSNDKELQQKIVEVSNLGINYYQQQANYVKNLVNNKQSPLDIQPKSILLIGQVEADLSVWDGIKYTNLDDYFDEIIKIASNYNTIYYKPHPFAKKNNDKIANATNIINTDIEIYRLLSSDCIEHVITVSSSVAKEAKFFNKKVTQFSSLYISDDCKSVPYTMDENFWNYMFDTSNNSLSKQLTIDYLDIRPIRNTYWGYKFILELELKPHEVYKTLLESINNDLVKTQQLATELSNNIEKITKEQCKTKIDIIKLQNKSILYILSKTVKKIKKNYIKKNR
ncbi:hypothetical protein FHR24_002238 [Wenyingzhuangia heitensis]|uniref:Capsule polysaccharide biosynthesis protein n=1 Tax=Wenyingzhuangia heitensis TaxID=1487859 RepID=A0ABX0UFI4_9FLAO|nr:hypothetical protein [Wenyingzhuangia heitensis]NIJ45767.1 hypothetical protein [Wenyingzhuangia heitensis]